MATFSVYGYLRVVCTVFVVTCFLGVFMFKWVKLTLFLLLFFFAILMGVTFALQNNTPSYLVVFNYTLPVFTVGVWVSIALFLGVVLGFVLSIFPLIFSYGLSARKDKKIARLESELSRLRMSAIKG